MPEFVTVHVSMPVDWLAVDCPAELAQESLDAVAPEPPPDDPMENGPGTPGLKIADGEHGCWYGTEKLDDVLLVPPVEPAAPDDVPGRAAGEF